MKKILKSKIFWGIIVIIVIGGAFYFRSVQEGKKVEYITAEVKLGDIIQTVSATGQIKSASEIELNFKNAGKISALNIDTGDKVVIDQILAQLKATDLAINVTKAQADLEESQANLNKLSAGATPEDIAVLEATLQKIQTDLMNTKTDLTSTEATYSQALENERQNILIDITSALTKANISTQEVYDTLNYKGDAKNFKSSNSVLEQTVNSEYSLSLTRIDEAELAYNLAKLDPIDDKIDESIDKALIALYQLQETLDDLAELLDYVIITAVLSRTELGTLKTSISTERTTTNLSISTAQTAKQNLADARLDYQTKVETAKNNVTVAEKNLIKAQADLDFKKAPARLEDVALYQARTKRALADLRFAQDKYEETILRAPIDGVVTEINFEIGEQTSLTLPAIKMLATENYEIEVDIPESDITKIEVGHQADITLDAFSDKDIFKGMVTTINPAQTEIQDVVYYKVTVSFEPNQPEGVADLVDRIKPGMTANIDVQTDKKENVLIVPSRAVKEQNGDRIVQILENNQPRDMIITTGLRGDEGLLEVTSGLNQGQQVITFIKEK